MRLVIDGRRLSTRRTGVGRYLEDLLAEWSEVGPPLDEAVVVLHDPAGRASVPPGSAEIRSTVVGAGWPGLAWERWGLGRVLRRGDVLFAPTNLLPGGWRGPSVVVVFDTLQEVLPGSFPRLVRLRFGGRYRRASRRATRIITPSEATARDVARHHGVDPSKIAVVHPAPGPGFRPIRPDSPDVADVRRTLGVDRHPYALFVGKTSARRNIGAMAAGFGRFRAGHPEHRLLVVGPIDDAERARLEETPGVVVAGFVADADVPRLMAGATALLYLSDYEGFGLPVAEAIACGCPVVTLDRGAVREAGGSAPAYLDAPTPAAVAEALGRIADDPEHRRGLVDRGLALAATRSRRRFAEAVKAEINATAGRR